MGFLSNKKLIGGASVDAILLIIAKFITTCSSLVINRLLSEFLSVYDYGTYSQILLIVSTVTSITILGMMDGVNYFYCNEHDPEKRESYIATIFAMQCTVGAVAGTVVMVLSVPLCAYFDNPDIKNLLVFAAVLPLLQNLFWLCYMLIVSIGKAKMLAFRNLVNAVVKLCAFAAIVLSGRGIALILMTTLIIDIVQLIYFWAILRKNKCRVRFSMIRPRLIGEILNYCLPMAMYVMINSLNRDMDKYMISLWSDTETLAIYANVSKLLPFDIIMSSFCTILVPKITRYIAAGEREKAAELYKTFIKISYIPTGILCCAALAASPQLLTLLYSEKYMSGLGVFCIYIGVELIKFTNITLVLAASGKTKTLMVVGLLSLLLNALLNVVFYHALGFIGPAIATILASAVLGCVMLYLGSKELQTKLSNLFDKKHLLIFTAESALLTTVLYRVQQWLTSKGLHYFVILVLICGAYCGIMLLLNGRTLIGALKKVNNSDGR